MNFHKCQKCGRTLHDTVKLKREHMERTFMNKDSILLEDILEAMSKNNILEID